MSDTRITNALTVDVEDYFHVAALAESISPDDWDSIAPRVVDNTQRILALFAEHDVHGTFFVLGWVAERFPELVREIAAGGHEVACHGFSHQLIYTQERAVFAEETRRAKALLEDVIGAPVRGYRAASYSITNDSIWALDEIIAAGFDYDSSIVPTSHDLYGMTSARREPHRITLDGGRSIVEFPPSTIDFLGKRLPIAGGGYFRIFPYFFSRWGMQRVNERDSLPFSFYMHPWEIDPGQPRVEVGAKSRFRHYHNLDKFEPRLRALLTQFRFGTMAEVLEQRTFDDFDVAELVGAT